MKKYLFAAIFSFAVSYASADSVSIPQGKGSNPLASADYGGVKYSTVAFSTNNILCFSGPGSVAGFVFSSTFVANDYVSFRDTNSVNLVGGGVVVQGDAATNVGDGSSNREFARVYVSSALNDAYTRQQTYSFPKPIRVGAGLAVRTNVRGELLTILWTKFD